MYSLWGWGYVGSYSMTNSDEYFANGLMTYFDVQYPYDEVIENVKTVCMVDFPRQLQQLGRSCSKWTPSLQPSWTGSYFVMMNIEFDQNYKNGCICVRAKNSRFSETS